MTEYDPVEIENHEHAAWESTATVYAEAAGFMTALSGQTELLTEFAGIDRSCRVLEVGCGPGQLTGSLSRVAESVEGIDFSSEMIRCAREAFPELSFEVANAENLPFEDNEFDVIVCNYTAHHFARPSVVFEEILTKLKVGGRIAVVHPVQSEQGSFGSFAESLYEQLPPEQLPSGPLLNISDPEDYVELLSNSGYSNVRCERRVKPVEISSLDQLLNAGWKIAGLDDQPQEIQERIRSGTIENAQKYKQPDGGYSFPDVVLIATGEKPIM